MTLTINGQPVDSAILDAEFASIKSYFESLGNVSCCERDGEFRGYARDNVIAKVLLAQEADRRVPVVDPARVDIELERLTTEHGGEQRLCAAMNISPDHIPLLRDNLEQNLRVETLLDEVCGRPPRPTDAELIAFYEEHVDAYLTEERVRAMHILRNPQKSEDRAAAYNDMRAARRRALAGEDFRKIAEECSDKVKEQAHAIQHGSLDAADAHDPVDLGFFKRGELVEEFDLVAFSLEPGEVSPVFGSAFGYHVVKLIEREPAVPKPFAEVRERVEADYLATWRDRTVRAFVEELKTAAKIEGGEESE